MTGADPARAELDARVLAWMAEDNWRDDDGRFEALALELFAWQFERCLPYARFCRGRDRTPASVSRWQDIPTVPTGAFKEMALRSFPAEREVHRFRTSGTSTDARGTLHLDTLALYEASLLPSFRRFVWPEAQRGSFRVLAPSAVEMPDSSLSHMFGVVLAELGDEASGFDVVAGELRLDTLLAACEAAISDARPVVLCGTAFAFVHLLDGLDRRELALPAGSRVMETGGFKGRARALTRDELHAALVEQLGVACDAIVNQYGMTELGSQFHDSVIARPGEPRRKLGPPWARVRIVDPVSGGEAAEGEAGMIEVVDLANTGSVIAIQTADLGRRIGDGFEVLGREPGAESRGCSIAADAMLSGAAS